MKEIRNVVIINDFNYIQGGASKVAIDTAKILEEAGMNIYFFSAVNKEKDELDRIRYISTNQQETIRDKNKIRGMLNGIYNVKARKELKALLKSLDKENTIIHIHGWTKALSSSVFDIAFKMKFKVVLTLHDYFTACPNGGYFDYKKNKICSIKPLSWKCIKCNCDSRNYAFKIYRLIRQFVQDKIVKLNKKLEYAISISDLSEKVLKETLGKQVEIQRVYNPVETLKSNVKVKVTENDYCLYVGRVSKEKGVDLFCEAITQLGKQGIVVGDGEEKNILEEKYTNVKFEGWKDKMEIAEYMKNARVLIFPSKWYEGAPLTIIEAQAIGLPVISSDCCSGIEFVNNKLIFDINNIEDLKSKIRVLEDDKIIDSISAELYKEYNVDHIVKYRNDISRYFERI